MPKRHPDQHALADLAAEVLPEEESRLVEAHVIGCPKCAQLLGDAERVRRLLLTTDPGPMPDQVWHRIAQALNVEALIDSSPVSAPTRHDPPPEPEEEFFDESTRPITTRRPSSDGDGPGTGQWERFLDTTVADDDLGGPKLPPPGTHDSVPTSVIRSVGSSGTRSRRQVREEDRHENLLRFVRPVTIAASVLVLAGLSGVFVSRLLDRGSTDTASGSMSSVATTGVAAQDRAEGSSSASGSAAANAPAAGVGTLSVASGTDYLLKTLGTQALKLTPEQPQTAPSTSRMTAADTKAQGGGAPAPTAPTTAAAPSSIPGNSELTDPTKLTACLAKLGIPDRQPIAMDFAKFEGRDAAIIVVSAPDGRYQVWAVGRTCGSPDGEGSYAQVDVSS